MSSSGLDWQPVVEAWLKTRNELEIKVFKEMFHESFGSLYAWFTQNLSLTMKVLQCNVVQQVSFKKHFT